MDLGPTTSVTRLGSTRRGGYHVADQRHRPRVPG